MDSLGDLLTEVDRVIWNRNTESNNSCGKDISNKENHSDNDSHSDNERNNDIAGNFDSHNVSDSQKENHKKIIPDIKSIRENHSDRQNISNKVTSSKKVLGTSTGLPLQSRINTPRPRLIIDDSESDDENLSKCANISSSPYFLRSRAQKSPAKSNFSQNLNKLIALRNARNNRLNNLTPRTSRVIISSDEEVKSDDGEGAEDIYTSESEENISDFVVSDDEDNNFPKTGCCTDMENRESDNEQDLIEFRSDSDTNDESDIESEPISAAESPSAKFLMGKEFKKQREDLANNLFKKLNECVFDSKLPSTLSIIWSQRLNTTAGRASYSKPKGETDISKWKINIMLASKVINDELKLSNTLAHEICHVACWIISNEFKHPHGKIFKSWASKIMKKFPDIRITTKHNYEIDFKYRWKCTNMTCGHIYGRHSKSVDSSKHLCGKCSSTLIAIDRFNNIATRSKPNAYALFVKENLSRIRQENPDVPNSKIMSLIAEKWKTQRENVHSKDTDSNNSNSINSMLSALTL